MCQKQSGPVTHVHWNRTGIRKRKRKRSVGSAALAFVGGIAIKETNTFWWKRNRGSTEIHRFRIPGAKPFPSSHELDDSARYNVFDRSVPVRPTLRVRLVGELAFDRLFLAHRSDSQITCVRQQMLLQGWSVERITTSFTGVSMPHTYLTIPHSMNSML